MLKDLKIGDKGIVRCLTNNPMYAHIGSKPFEGVVTNITEKGFIINVNGITEELFMAAPVGPLYSADHKVFFRNMDEYYEDLEKEKLIAEISKHFHKMNLPAKRVYLSLETLQMMHSEIMQAINN